MAIKHFREVCGDRTTRMAALKADVDERTRLTQLGEALKKGRAEGREEGVKIGEERGIKIGEKRGKQRGIEIGEKRGKQRGIEIGEERGKHRNAVETARKLAARGMEPSLITELTGLAPDGWR
jgi:hypothetical protein